VQRLSDRVLKDLVNTAREETRFSMRSGFFLKQTSDTKRLGQ
jgi:hypothetical protein